jgi:hypothetical protein
MQRIQIKHNEGHTFCYQQAPEFDDMSSFFWYVTDNIRIYTNSVHQPLDIEMYILCFLVIFFISDFKSFFVCLHHFCQFRHFS